MSLLLFGRLRGVRVIFISAWVAIVPLLQAAEPVDVSARLESVRAEHRLPCLAAVVIRGDQIVAQGVAGVRKAGDPTPATLNDRFHLGSDTKAMTATLIAGLIEEGKLSWTTTVGEVFGSRIPNMDAAWKPVTLAQLLTHRAGAPANLDAGGLWGRLWQRKGTPTRQRLELVEGVVTHPPAAPPGTTYIYSNAGFAIAGAMAEKVTGRAWEDLIQERLFRPLGITTAGFGAPGTPGRIDQPWGHTAAGKPVEPGPNADNPPAMGPAGSVNMTIGDWAKFVSLHLRADAANPHGHVMLLKPATFARLHQPAAGPGMSYACGWIVAQRAWARGPAPAATGLVYSHDGTNTMWYCTTWLAPEKDFALLVTCNQGGDSAAKACDEAVGRLIQQMAH